jgi:hypothetical protein
MSNATEQKHMISNASAFVRRFLGFPVQMSIMIKIDKKKEGDIFNAERERDAASNTASRSV